MFSRANFTGKVNSQTQILSTESTFILVLLIFAPLIFVHPKNYNFHVPKNTSNLSKVFDIFSFLAHFQFLRPKMCENRPISHPRFQHL